MTELRLKCLAEIFENDRILYLEVVHFFHEWTLMLMHLNLE